MPAHRLDMRLFKEVLRLKLTARLSHRQIASALRIGVGTVSNYLAAFERSGLPYPLPDGMDEADLRRLLFPPTTASSASEFAVPDFSDIHEQLRLKGVTRQLLWEEYCHEHGSRSYSYTQFCVRYRKWVGRRKLSMRQTHRPGEKVFVDYCGKTIPIINAATGGVAEAQIFVAVLGASNYTYAEATRSQKLGDWIGSHTRAFEFFGGVPQLVVPDNLKSAVTKACRYEPLLNQTYEEMLSHYNTAALPARPAKPKDKAKVEAGVQVVTRWILARLRHHQFFSLFALNLEIRRLLVELNDREFKRLPGTRRSRFEELDQPVLQPLPLTAYEYAEWRKARVGIDYHIEFERHYYSVPAAFVKREVEVRLTAQTIECFSGGKRIAAHARSSLQGAHSTQTEHMPKAHRAHLEWTPGRFLSWAGEIGEATRELVQHLLWTRPHPEMGYRSCLGLLGLKKRFGAERLEAACQRALDNGTPARRSVLSILQNGLDRLPPAEETEQPLPAHGNIRGSSYYQ
ncbi:MAG: IS21 family transposase [Pyrinomonadaceae bacterium]